MVEYDSRINSQNPRWLFRLVICGFAGSYGVLWGVEGCFWGCEWGFCVLGVVAEVGNFGLILLLGAREVRGLLLFVDFCDVLRAGFCVFWEWIGGFFV